MPEENPLANLDEETQNQIQEIQFLEQGFQQLMMQKRAFNSELNETDLSLKELEKATGEVFKIVGGQIVIKSTKEDLEKDQKHKKELIETRLKNLDKQEKELSERIEELREKIMKKISSKPK